MSEGNACVIVINGWSARVLFPRKSLPVVNEKNMYLGNILFEKWNTHEKLSTAIK